MSSILTSAETQGKEDQSNNSDNEDSDIELSADALAALTEFYTEKAKEEEYRARLEGSTWDAEHETIEPTAQGEAPAVDFRQDLHAIFPEDWQMSQFWYDKESAAYLAEKVISVAGGRQIACISCPSIFHAICAHEGMPLATCSGVHLFEFDQRFRAYGSNFKFYDYKHPLKVPEGLSHKYSVVVADPPFLSNECLEKVAETIKYLMAPDAKVILCTGSVMEATAEDLLGLRKIAFAPRHKNNLGNDFGCFTNFDL